MRDELAAPQRWEAWAPWVRRADAGSLRLGGPAAGPGASLYWAEGTDRGRLTVTRADAAAVELELERPGSAPADVEIRLEPDGAGTRIRASVGGERGLRARLRALLRREDARFAADLEQGLSRLGPALARREPRKWRVERAAQLAASQAAVLDALGDLRRWPAWSPWMPDGARQACGGPERGPGASCYWAEPGPGAIRGRLTVIAAAPGSLELEVERRGATADVELRADPAGRGTQLTWAVQGEDGAGAEGAEELGRRLDRGLARLAALLEKGAGPRP